MRHMERFYTEQVCHGVPIVWWLYLLHSSQSEMKTSGSSQQSECNPVGALQVRWQNKHYYFSFSLILFWIFFFLRCSYTVIPLVKFSQIWHWHSLRVVTEYMQTCPYVSMCFIFVHACLFMLFVRVRSWLCRKGGVCQSTPSPRSLVQHTAKSSPWPAESSDSWKLVNCIMFHQVFCVCLKVCNSGMEQTQFSIMLKLFFIMLHVHSQRTDVWYSLQWPLMEQIIEVVLIIWLK